MIHNVFFLGQFSFLYDANVHTPASPWGVYVIFVPVLGGLVVTFLVKNFAPEARGHGVPEVMDAIYYKEGIIRPCGCRKIARLCLLHRNGRGRWPRGSDHPDRIVTWIDAGELMTMAVWQRITLVAAGAGAGIAAKRKNGCMTPFQMIATVVTLSAIGSYINYKYLKFPPTVGLMALALVVSLVMIVLGRFEIASSDAVGLFVGGLNFSEVLLHGMLSFLLFAGALHINLAELNSVRWSVAVLATIGVITATIITGTLVWLASAIVGLELPYLYALLFGALISPTDPIAVLAILKDSGISKKTYTKIGAESLFNDGVGVVAFLTLIELVNSAGELKIANAAALFLQEALGGATFGLVCGWITYRLLRSIDEYKVEVLLTLALATGGYALAEELHVSAPIFMVTAGLIVGNHGRNLGMSEVTRERLDVFWELIDEVLNAVLFILIGLEIVVISITAPQVYLGVLAILAVLAGRVISVGVPSALMGLGKHYERGTIALLTWGGLRGGLSIAMALSLPLGAQKDIILPVTYIVVLFSILVQGLTFKPALKYLITPTSPLEI